MKTWLTFIRTFCVLFVFFPFSIYAQTVQFFDYPPELLNQQPITTVNQPASEPTIIFDNSAPAPKPTTQTNTPNITRTPSAADQLRSLELFNPNSGIPVGVEEQVSVEFSPNNPQAREPFIIRIESFSTDLNRASINWRVNGSVYASGTGVVQESFQAPEAGEILDIELLIRTVEGNEIFKTYTIAPARVDLYYEADTYTPPFYQGKRIYTHQSDVTVYAFPYISEGGELLDRSQLSYIWEVDNRVVQDQSGYGRSSFTYNSGLLSQDVKISVTASSVNNPSVAEADIFISPKTPNILLFENHPLYGLMYRNIINNFYELTSTEVFLTAIPLFFSIDTRDDSNLQYSWNLNGERLDIFDNESEIAFRNSNNETGEAQVRLNIRNSDKILQSVSDFGEIFFSAVDNLIDSAEEIVF